MRYEEAGGEAFTMLDKLAVKNMPITVETILETPNLKLLLGNELSFSIPVKTYIHDNYSTNILISTHNFFAKRQNSLNLNLIYLDLE